MQRIISFEKYCGALIRNSTSLKQLYKARERHTKVIVFFYKRVIFSTIERFFCQVEHKNVITKKNIPQKRDMKNNDIIVAYFAVLSELFNKDSYI